MVAKSYQALKQCSEPYVVSGKEYVDVEMKSGAIKKVRWYNEKEYRKMYPEITTVCAPHKDKYYKPLKDVLGFKNGYITIFKGNVEENEDWFRRSEARYSVRFGWYFTSESTLTNIPFGLIPIGLRWESVFKDENTLKSDETIKAIVEGSIYDEGNSEFQGEIGSTIKINATCIRATPIEDNYGSKTIHLFKDPIGNLYTWTTASKSLSEGTSYSLSGRVKDHQIYKNQKQTCLTRCRIL